MNWCELNPHVGNSRTGVAARTAHEASIRANRGGCHPTVNNAISPTSNPSSIQTLYGTVICNGTIVFPQCRRSSASFFSTSGK